MNKIILHIKFIAYKLPSQSLFSFQSFVFIRCFSNSLNLLSWALQPQVKEKRVTIFQTIKIISLLLRWFQSQSLTQMRSSFLTSLTICPSPFDNFYFTIEIQSQLGQTIHNSKQHPQLINNGWDGPGFRYVWRHCYIYTSI